jgi:predicted esterase
MEVPQRKLDVPLLIATGRADALIPPSAQYAAVTAMCRVGNRVVWNSYAGVGHSGTSNYALKDAIPFARALLAGQKVQSNCGAINAPPPLEKMDPAIPFND